MPTIAQQIKKIAVGKEDCEQCLGTGMYNIYNCKIFCEKCLGEETISMIWITIDGYIKNHKKVKGFSKSRSARHTQSLTSLPT